MSKIIDKIAPEILFHKYLGKELKALRETFDRNWDEKHDQWRGETIDWLAGRLDMEYAELKKAIKFMWEDAFLHYSLIVRMRQVHAEWLDVALVALMGADKTRRECESLEKRLKKRPTVEAPESELEIVEILDAEPEPEGGVSLFTIQGDEHDRPIEEVVEEFEGIVKNTEAEWQAKKRAIESEPEKIVEVMVALTNKDEEDFQAEEATREPLLDDGRPIEIEDLKKKSAESEE